MMHFDDIKLVEESLGVNLGGASQQRFDDIRGFVDSIEQTISKSKRSGFDLDTLLLLSNCRSSLRIVQRNITEIMDGFNGTQKTILAPLLEQAIEKLNLAQKDVISGMESRFPNTGSFGVDTLSKMSSTLKGAMPTPDAVVIDEICENIKRAGAEISDPASRAYLDAVYNSFELLKSNTSTAQSERGDPSYQRLQAKCERIREYEEILISTNKADLHDYEKCIVAHNKLLRAGLIDGDVGVGEIESRLQNLVTAAHGDIDSALLSDSSRNELKNSIVMDDSIRGIYSEANFERSCSEMFGHLRELTLWKDKWESEKNAGIRSDALPEERELGILKKLLRRPQTAAESPISDDVLRDQCDIILKIPNHEFRRNYTSIHEADSVLHVFTKASDALHARARGQGNIGLSIDSRLASQYSRDYQAANQKYNKLRKITDRDFKRTAIMAAGSVFAIQGALLTIWKTIGKSSGSIFSLKSTVELPFGLSFWKLPVIAVAAIGTIGVLRFLRNRFGVVLESQANEYLNKTESFNNELTALGFDKRGFADDVKRTKIVAAAKSLGDQLIRDLKELFPEQFAPVGDLMYLYQQAVMRSNPEARKFMLRDNRENLVRQRLETYFASNEKLQRALGNTQITIPTDHTKLENFIDEYISAQYCPGSFWAYVGDSLDRLEEEMPVAKIITSPAKRWLEFSQRDHKARQPDTYNLAKTMGNFTIKISLATTRLQVETAYPQGGPRMMELAQETMSAWENLQGYLKSGKGTYLFDTKPATQIAGARMRLLQGIHEILKMQWWLGP